VRAADLAFRPKDRRFALVCNRFDQTPTAGRRLLENFDRSRAGLRFEGVRRCQVSGFDPAAHDTVMVLLAITFKPDVAPAGHITLQFAAGCAVRLDVEYIEAELKDLGAVWSTRNKPDHGEQV
jgi:hypothetical protein